MFKKTIAATAIGAGSLLLAAVPASAGDGPEGHGDTGQIGLINVDDTLNNLCALPWNDGNVLAVEVPLLSPNTYQACNEGKAIQG